MRCNNNAVRWTQSKKAFRKKGFEEQNKHHIYFVYYTLGGEPTSIETFMSHGSKQKVIGDKLAGYMARQLGLTKKQFIELVECTIDQKEYEKIVSEKLGDKE